MSSILADTHRLELPSWGKPYSKDPPISNKTVDPTPPASPTDVSPKAHTDVSPKAHTDVSPKAHTSDAVAKKNDSKVSVAEQVALAMGIPEIVVQMAKDFQLLEHGRNFADASELYAAAEDLLNNPHKQAYIGKKLYEHAEKEKTQSKDLIESKDRKEHSTAKDSVCSSAEMLMDKVKRLAHENHKLRQRKVCRECKKVDLASSGVTFLPCGHFITCETCSEKFDNCPACSKSIMGTVRTFLS